MVELLAAVAIVAILMSLIIPAASGMHEKSRSSKCLNNMRQIGAALAAYAGEHDGYNPALIDENDKDWDQAAIFPYLPPRTNPNGSQRQNTAFICPSAKYVGFANNDLSRTYSSTEFMIGADGENGSSYRVPTKRVNYPSLSGSMILFDGCQNNPNRYCRQVASWNQVVNMSSDLKANTTAQTYIDYRHGKAFNGLFADGHSETIKRSDASKYVTSRMWKGE